MYVLSLLTQNAQASNMRMVHRMVSRPFGTSPDMFYVRIGDL